jgi:5-methylcytosine-specific restriction endonuclease McrA
MDQKLKQLDNDMETEMRGEKQIINNNIKQIKSKYSELKTQISKEKSKRKTIPKSVKDKLWNLTYGREAGIGDCYCCQETIDSKSFHAGHIISAHDGGSDNISNLKPICATCNLSMGTQNLEEFTQIYYGSMYKNCKKCHKDIEYCSKLNYNNYSSNGFILNDNMCVGYINRQCGK